MFISEALNLFFESLFRCLCGILGALIECIPGFNELKQSLSLCAPANAWAMFFGIPLGVVTLIKEIPKVARFIFTHANNDPQPLFHDCVQEPETLQKVHGDHKRRP